MPNISPGHAATPAALHSAGHGEPGDLVDDVKREILERLDFRVLNVLLGDRRWWGVMRPASVTMWSQPEVAAAGCSSTIARQTRRNGSNCQDIGTTRPSRYDSFPLTRGDQSSSMPGPAEHGFIGEATCSWTT